ncbi:hypothetical protein CQ018_17915 [Arthrobacter sp. MYb227]|uniref:acyltransferase domain-containing protein n=1 Tax=Arthrobacter sp. MYb227 TaxID=1848601 RepID=UPI000CFE285D|nr:acyltransferase domain-containing protein [Arthrobacter sp. MYb227]PQZ87332.1 hypothetical protein CQ018_17915 [Arthrobacter sp. MYb227]
MSNSSTVNMTQAVLDLCAVPAAEQEICARMLSGQADAGTRKAIELLAERWGDAQAPLLKHVDGITERQWIEALLRFSPLAAERLEEAGVVPMIIEATLADFGKQLELHRQTHGEFGLTTWWWLLLHFSGALFRLGRLQFHLHPQNPSGESVVGIHIPEDGALDPAAVDASLNLAAHFYAEHYPEILIDHAYCDSWLLDPALAEGLPGSNIAAFAARFSDVRLRDAQADALYFTFRVPADADVSTLPQDSSLQRLVLARIAAGGTWQCGKGTSPWPVPTKPTLPPPVTVRNL